MISVYKLASVINESANGYRSNVPAYEFNGTLLEACYEMDQEILRESVSCDELIAKSNELMIEASINNPAVMQVLQENVFTSIKEGVSKFFKKVIAMIKGIIEKLKAAFYKMTGKIDKWVSVMEPKINAAASKNSAKDCTYEMYAWDEHNVKSLMLGKMDELLTKLEKFKGKNASQITTIMKSEASNSASARGSLRFEATDVSYINNDNVELKAAKYEKVEGPIKELNKKIEEEHKSKEKEMLELSETYGFGKTAKAANVWANLDKEIRGGSSKKTVNIHGKRTDMLEFVRKSKESISELKEKYDANLEIVTKIKETVEEIDFDKFYSSTARDTMEDRAQTNSDAVTAIKNAVQSTITDCKSYVSLIENIMNAYKTKNVEYIKAMTSEYMSALTKYASSK